MHTWGDTDVDWEGISDAAQFIATYLRKWGRVGVRDWKEKWGTVRVYCSLGWHQLHCITHPGHAYSRYPKWLWHLDCRYLSRFIRLLNPVVARYHAWLYTRAYGLAIRKWPHLRLEILSGADYSELLEKFGVHRIRTGDRMYEIRYDWHPQNYVSPPEHEIEEGSDE